jgi:uracil-DNA glycosylase family 4
MPKLTPLQKLHNEVIGCQACPRLRAYCQAVAETKRRSYQDEAYWGRPIPGFGEEKASLMIVGLAPAAHGGNRTGRIFTGDRSGDWLYRALHKAGFANQPTSVARDDGLELEDCYISCVVRCAPPDNQPAPDELARCSSYLEQEIRLLAHARVYLALGGIALQGLWPHIGPRTATGKLATRPKFGHGAKFELQNGNRLLMSYHPSQQNTFTGRLTEPMFDSIFAEARMIIAEST